MDKKVCVCVCVHTVEYYAAIKSEILPPRLERFHTEFIS